MVFHKRFPAVLVAISLFLTGCSMPTLDQMYCLPRRSEEYNDLQAAIDSAMVGLEYCAPKAGEFQQTVQMADLDGDGLEEYLLFAKGTMEQPLRVLIFRYRNGTYVHADTIVSNGTAFDMVEYIQMDGNAGLEMVIGCQLSNRVLRSVSVYTFARGMSEQLMSVNYSKFLSVDFDGDSLRELFVLRPGLTDVDNGIAELYGVENGVMERSNEATMSQPTDKLKRIITGKLHGGQPAVYVASTVGETGIITDVFTISNEKLANITVSGESGTSVQTIRNYYVYGDDIDRDGVVELPDLIAMKTSGDSATEEQSNLIRWYAVSLNGEEVDKMYTYHNFMGGWYMQLDGNWAHRLLVRNYGNRYEFLIWDTEFQTTEKLLSIYALTGHSRNEQAAEQNRVVLMETDSTVYACVLEDCAALYGLDSDSIIDSFRMIRREWKTGET